MSQSLSIAIAIQGGSKRIANVLDALEAQSTPDVEILLCHAAEETAVPALAEGRRARVVPGARGALIPHLWRDGILAASGERVALTIGHVTPGPGWIAALRAADLTKFAGVGGALENEPGSDALGWAVFILRYARFLPPFLPRETGDLPGDNVVYDRSALLAHVHAFEEGFWEPEIHALLLAEGHRLLLDPALLGVHTNAYGTFGFAAQRFRHGIRFGYERALRMSRVRRAAQLALFPLVPAVFGAKVLLQAARRPPLRAHLPEALPYLALFVHAWALGELSGTVRATVQAAEGRASR